MSVSKCLYGQQRKLLSTACDLYRSQLKSTCLGVNETTPNSDTNDALEKAFSVIALSHWKRAFVDSTGEEDDTRKELAQFNASYDDYLDVALSNIVLDDDQNEEYLADPWKVLTERLSSIRKTDLLHLDESLARILPEMHSRTNKRKQVETIFCDGDTLPDWLKDAAVCCMQQAVCDLGRATREMKSLVRSFVCDNEKFSRQFEHEEQSLVAAQNELLYYVRVILIYLSAFPRDSSNVKLGTIKSFFNQTLAMNIEELERLCDVLQVAIFTRRVIQTEGVNPAQPHEPTLTSVASWPGKYRNCTVCDGSLHKMRFRFTDQLTLCEQIPHTWKHESTFLQWLESTIDYLEIDGVPVDEHFSLQRAIIALPVSPDNRELYDDILDSLEEWKADTLCFQKQKKAKREQR